MTKDEMVGWHRQLNGHEFGQAPGVGDGLRDPACCSPWSCKESDTTERLNQKELRQIEMQCLVQAGDPTAILDHEQP